MKLRFNKFHFFGGFIFRGVSLGGYTKGCSTSGLQFDTIFWGTLYVYLCVCMHVGLQYLTSDSIAEIILHITFSVDGDKDVVVDDVTDFQLDIRVVVHPSPVGSLSDLSLEGSHQSAAYLSVHIPLEREEGHPRRICQK